MALVLRPHLRLRKEPYGVILVSDDPFEAEGWNLRTIDPTVAIVLSLFNGSREMDQIRHAVETVFKLSSDQAESFVKRILDELHFCLTEYKEPLRHLYPNYDPKEFVYKAVDLNAGEKARPSTPLSLVYVVTGTCNRRCLYCYADASPSKSLPADKNLLSLSRLKQLFEEAGRIGVVTVVISGGEPFLRPDILEIIGFVIQNRMYPWVSTKAGLSTDIVQKLWDQGLRRIQVSIDSSDPKSAAMLSGSKVYYDEILQTIKLLVKQGIEVQTNTVVTAYNIDQISNMVDFLVALGVRDICLTPYTRSLGRHNDKLFASKEALGKLLVLTEKYQENERVIVRYAADLILKLEQPGEEAFAQRLFCSAGRLGMVILPDGKVTICERLAGTPNAIVGDVERQSLAEVWNSMAIRDLTYPPREKFLGTECYICGQFHECTNVRGRCFVRSLLTSGEIFGPDPLCPKSSLPSKRLV